MHERDFFPVHRLSVTRPCACFVSPPLYTVHHGRDSETSQVAYVTFKEFHGADTALLLSVRAHTPLAAAASLANISEHFFLLFLLSVNRRRFSIQKLQS
jgi:hypothetical protein